MARQAWEDNLPYGNGCRHFKDCFSCPFDDCIQGTLVESKRTVYRAIKEQVQALLRQGKAVREIMDTLNVSQRSVYRYWREMS